MNRLENRLSQDVDMVVSHLHSQIVNLTQIVGDIERTHDYEEGHIRETIKTVEYELRRLRRYIDA